MFDHCIFQPCIVGAGWGGFALHHGAGAIAGDEAKNFNGSNALARGQNGDAGADHVFGKVAAGGVIANISNKTGAAAEACQGVSGVGDAAAGAELFDLDFV